jgi:hypothetical protein
MYITSNDEQNCCASHILDSVGDVPDGSGTRPAVMHEEGVPYKFVIAHELGHVVAGHRMGGKEPGSEYPGTSPLRNCMGDWYWVNCTTVDIPETGCSGAGWELLPSDDGTGGDRGEFTREYMGKVLRESWANFVAIVAFNNRGEDDCTFDGHRWHDFDLDGDLDNDWDGNTSNTGADGRYDCEGIPTTGEPDVGDPLETYVTSENWLDDLQTADDDGEDQAQCTRADDADKEANRSTVFDATRMWWDLTTEHGLTPAQLATLYIDSCPKGWAATDVEAGVGAYVEDDLPLERLKLSAAYHGWDDELDAEISHVEH